MITDAERREIERHVTAGNSIRDAAALAGVAEGDVRDEARRDPAWRQVLVTAHAKSDAKAIDVVRGAIDSGDAKTAAWWLERRQPAQWHPDTHRLVQIEFDRVLAIIEATLSPVEYERVLLALAEGATTTTRPRELGP